ncbi:MAG: HD domain-containing protein [Lachnospiraceae bacterium]|nr:HD domain-containing protein [Lachnospiraceae bacterium]
MADRVEIVQNHVKQFLEALPDPYWRTKGIAHSFGVSLAAVLLAKKRGLDPECAAIAGLLHDLYAYQVQDYEDHARRGAAFAKKILEDLQVTSDTETVLICEAIASHDDLDKEDASFSELLKDADFIQNKLTNPNTVIAPEHQARHERLKKEFGF